MSVLPQTWFNALLQHTNRRYDIVEYMNQTSSLVCALNNIVKILFQTDYILINIHCVHTFKSSYLSKKHQRKTYKSVESGRRRTKATPNSLEDYLLLSITNKFQFSKLAPTRAHTQISTFKWMQNKTYSSTIYNYNYYLFILINISHSHSLTWATIKSFSDFLRYSTPASCRALVQVPC